MLDECTNYYKMHACCTLITPYYDPFHFGYWILISIILVNRCHFTGRVPMGFQLNKFDMDTGMNTWRMNWHSLIPFRHTTSCKGPCHTIFASSSSTLAHSFHSPPLSERIETLSSCKGCFFEDGNHGWLLLEEGFQRVWCGFKSLVSPSSFLIFLVQ